ITADALERNPAERDSFVTDACGGDSEVFREVGRLLKEARESGTGFLSAAAWNVHEFLAEDSRQRQRFSIAGRAANGALLGKTLGHYRIEGKLGEGGMGVVFRALDAHLDRTVAIKVLLPSALPDADGRRRFVQEAKAASALNHPNIITIYDINAADLDG